MVDPGRGQVEGMHCVHVLSRGFMPGPFSSIYASTKSFLSMFGASIAAEVESRGIDVLVFHPSPIASRFYDDQKKIDMLDFFKNFAANPDTIPDQVFASVGRTVWADLGTTAMSFRVLTKLSISASCLLC